MWVLTWLCCSFWCDYILLNLLHALDYCNRIKVPLDATGAARAVAFADAGYSQRHNARMLGVPRITVRDAITRFWETGSYTRRPGQDSHWCTSARDDRFIVNNVLRNRFTTAPEVRTRLFEVRNVSVSEQTVSRGLAERNQTAFRPARAPELLTQHRRARLQFAREYAKWSTDQWNDVLFSDESWIVLWGPDGCQRVYRWLNESLPRVRYWKLWLSGSFNNDLRRHQLRRSYRSCRVW